MLGKLIANVVLGLVVVGVGVIVYQAKSFENEGLAHAFGISISVVGAGYALFFGLLYGVPILVRICERVARTSGKLFSAARAAEDTIRHLVKDREQAKAQERLLRYKQLFDAGLITQEEYAEKAVELKKLIL